MGYELQLVDQLEVSVSNCGISSLVFAICFFLLLKLCPCFAQYQTHALYNTYF